MTTDQNSQLPPQHGEPTANPDWLKCVSDLGEEALKRLADWRGYSLEFCVALKKLFLIGMFQGRIAFPVYNSGTRVVGCHHRPLSGEVDWRVHSFTNGSVEMTPLVVNEPGRKDTVMVFESQWDMFALMNLAKWQDGNLAEYGFIATRGAKNGKRIAYYCRPKTVVLAFPQNDNAGEDWLHRVAKAAPGPVGHVKIPSPHKDLNDWTRTGATWEIIEEAACNREIIKDKLPKNVGAITDGESDLDYAYEGQRVLGTAKDGRILVPLPINKNRLLSEFASDLGRALTGKGLYNRGGLVFALDASARSLSLVTPDCFRTWAEQSIVCFTIKESKDGPPERLRKSMTKSDAAAVLAAAQFQTHLPTIRKLNQVPLPVLRKSEKIELLPIGFDAESQTYTFDSPGLDFPKEMSLPEAKRVLDLLFAEFCFPEDGGRSLAVVVAGMMTMFSMGLLPKGALPPCFMVMANAEGAGKTLLVNVMVTPIAGLFVASSKPQNEEELRKRLTVSVMDGRSYEVLDNVKDHLESPSLEAFLTTSIWSDRVLGSSKSFTGEKQMVLFITGNSCTVSPDMRRRSLFVELFMREERAEERKFARVLDVPFLLEKRGEILSALWTLVKDWDQKGRPPGSKAHSSYPEWTRTIAAIVENAGYASPVEMPKMRWDVDRDGAEMRKLVDALAKEDPALVDTLAPNEWEKEFTFAEIVQFARKAGAFESLLGVQAEQAELDNKMRTRFSRFLSRYNGRFFGDIVFMVKGEGHGRRYAFRSANLHTSIPEELK